MSNYGPYTGDTYEGSPEESHDMEAEAAASYAAAMEAENVNAMTEQDERAIYEWVYPELKGNGWRKEYNGMTWGALYWREDKGFDWRLPLADLDHNFALDVCVPKLYTAGCTVIFKRSATDRDYRDGYWKILWGGYPERLDEACQHDFYDALLAYIRGVK